MNRTKDREGAQVLWCLAKTVSLPKWSILNTDCSIQLILPAFDVWHHWWSRRGGEFLLSQHALLPIGCLQVTEHVGLDFCKQC